MCFRFKTKRTWSLEAQHSASRIPVLLKESVFQSLVTETVPVHAPWLVDLADFRRGPAKIRIREHSCLRRKHAISMPPSLGCNSFQTMHIVKCTDFKRMPYRDRESTSACATRTGATKCPRRRNWFRPVCLHPAWSPPRKPRLVLGCQLMNAPLVLRWLHTTKYDCHRCSFWKLPGAKHTKGSPVWFLRRTVQSQCLRFVIARDKCLVGVHAPHAQGRAPRTEATER